MRPWCHTDRKHHTQCSLTSVSPDGYPQVLIAGSHRLSLLVHLSSLHHHSLRSIHLKLLSCWVESTYPFAARVVDSHPSLLHPSGGHNFLTRCWLQMFLKPQVCEEFGNRTPEHQSGHQSSYWLWTSMLNLSDLKRTKLKTVEWDILNPDNLIWVSNGHTFDFLCKLLFLGYSREKSKTGYLN